MSSRLLAGRYELLEKIGDGGMAIVYKAKCRVLNRFVAIKILKPEYTKDVKFIENFRRESQAAASLNHPNIVNVYDVGREGNINYIVMELIEGKVLSDVINEEGPLEPNRVISIAKQVALALSFAHKNQIIHRDVKPHNILLTDNGIAKLTDFGIAKAVNAATIIGQTGTVMGSVHYFSPEQARGGYVDEKSDIYSLGIVLYEMLTGRVPFNADNPVAVAVMHMNEQMIPPSQLVPSVPPDLEAVVMKATDKYQTNRYKNVDEMYEALDRAAFSLLGFSRQNAPNPYMDKGLDATATMVAINSQRQQNNKPVQNNMPVNNRPIGNSSKESNLQSMGEDEMAKEKKKKFRINLIKVLAVVLALACAIPASHFVLNAIKSIGKDKEVAVVSVVGLEKGDAKQQLENQGFKCKIGDKVESDEYDEGYVVSQTPDKGNKLKKGSTVTINISKGMSKDSIPGVVGESYEDAITILKDAGFSIGNPTREDSNQPKDQVLRQDPTGGTKAEPGKTVNLVLSTGKSNDEAKMPNLIGLTEEKASQSLEEANLIAGRVTTEASSKYAKGKVIWQEYEVGEKLDPGTAVNFKISAGEDNTNTNNGDQNTGPKSVPITIDYSQWKNEVIFLTVVVADATGTHTLINGEERLRSSGSETISVTGQGTGTVSVIFDNTTVMKKNVDFNTGTVS